MGGHPGLWARVAFPQVVESGGAHASLLSDILCGEGIHSGSPVQSPF